MTPRVRIAELRDNLSKFLRRVENGETLEVLDRDRPIAHLVPIKDEGTRIRPAKRPFSPKAHQHYTRLGPPGFDILDVLLEDRRKR